MEKNKNLKSITKNFFSIDDLNNFKFNPKKIYDVILLISNVRGDKSSLDFNLSFNGKLTINCYTSFNITFKGNLDIDELLINNYIDMCYRIFKLNFNTQINKLNFNVYFYPLSN